MNASSKKHVIFDNSFHFVAQNWIPKSSNSRSLRRRIMAILRRAHRVLGIDRKRLGLGTLGMGGAIAIATLSMIAAPAMAQVMIDRINTSTDQDSTANGTGIPVPTPAAAGIVLGVNAQSGATGQNVAIGPAAIANAATVAGGAVSIGRGNKAIGDGAVALGDPNAAIGQGAVAMGLDSVASRDGTVNGGSTNGPVAIGNSVIAAGQGSVSIGNQTRANAEGAIALGDRAVAGHIGGTLASGDIAIGTLASATGFNSIAIGVHAEATATNSVALGIQSKTRADLAAPGYNPGNIALAGIASTLDGEISVGDVGTERRVTNVAAGAVSTDAVNVSQLQSENAKLDTLGEAAAAAFGGPSQFDPRTGQLTVPSYIVQGNAVSGVAGAVQALDKIAGNSVQYDRNPNGAPSTGDITLAGRKNAAGNPIGTMIHNVEAGVAPADAVNFGQLQGVADIATKGWNLSTQGATASQVRPGDTVNFSSTDANITVATGTKGSDVNVTLAQDLAVASLTAGDTVLNRGGITVAGGLNGPVKLTGTGLDNGGNTISGVGAGKVREGSTDAVNGSQLLATNQALASRLGGGSTVDPEGRVSAPSFSIHNPGSMTAETPYNNAGDALEALDKGMAGNTSAIAQLGTNIANGAFGVVQRTAADGRLVLVALGGTGAAPGKAQQLTNVAGGRLNGSSADAVNGAQLYATNQQVAGNAADITNLSRGISDGTVGLVRQEKGSPDNGRITIGGMTGGSGINIAGTDGDRVISGIRNGVAADDAVTVSQLAAAITTASVDAVQYDGADHGSVTFNAGGGAAGLRNVSAGQLDAASRDAINGAQLYATNQQVAYNETQIMRIEGGHTGPFRSNNASGSAEPAASGVDAIAGGSGALASGSRSTALGAGSSATGSNSVALGYGSSDGGIGNIVSVGSVGGERQVTNVAAGTRSTDAANVGQVSAGLAQNLVLANGYTDKRINALSFDLATARRDADAGTASAMAVAGLPQAFTPGGGMIAGAVGVYGDKTAIAIGASKIFNGGQAVMKGGATYTETSRGGTFGANVGIGWQF
jgi:autotransporter adhesin